MLSIFAVSASSDLEAAPLGFKVGIETEYAADASAEKKRPEVFRWILERVRKKFDGLGEISIRRWSKYSNSKKAIGARYFDPQGRQWKVIPEIMDNGFDGYEFVTPPLKSTEDWTLAKSVYREIDAGGVFRAGKSSSTHFTFDVRNLIGPRGEASRLVDTILYIENHWLELYSIVKPTRYQGIVNGYAVPLAAGHQALLNELAALPKERRTYQIVRGIFQKYDALERELCGDRSTCLWKFRAANYGRLFELGEFPRAPVIEFRIADLMELDRLETTLYLFASVIQNGAKLEPNAPFRAPFGKMSIRPFDDPKRPLDEVIEKTPKEKVRDFLAIHSVGMPSHCRDLLQETHVP